MIFYECVVQQLTNVGFNAFSHRIFSIFSVFVFGLPATFCICAWHGWIANEYGYRSTVKFVLDAYTFSALCQEVFLGM